MTAHCSIEQLESLLRGNPPAELLDSVQRHVEQCAACSTAMEKLAGGPIWCQETAAMLHADELDDAMPSFDEASDIDFTVEHLEPSNEPNVLGKLGGYDVLEVIGRGGFGIVLKARDPQLNRNVAIKVLAPHLALNSLARKRFAREAQAAAAVVHPHVLAIHQVQPSGKLPFLVMPLVAGESLAQRISQQGSLELIEILRIGMQAAAGLAAAHEQGLVHRDVKPANILLEKGVERAVLTDFGLARAADDVALTRWGIIAGTPQYMSPEQAQGHAVDGRSDLFSLGCVLYEMATGVSPFKTESAMATMRRLVDDQPQAMASHNPELPPWFVAIVERLLEKDPAKRFGSAKEVSDLLEGCLAHVQQPAHVPLPAGLPAPKPVPKVQPLERPRGGTGWVKLAAGLLLAVLGGAAAFLYATDEPPELAGTWSGVVAAGSDAPVETDYWGTVTLRQTNKNTVDGTFTQTIGKNPGEIHLDWNFIERKYKGTWRDNDERRGTINVLKVGDQIEGQWTTDPKSKINLPDLAGLKWKSTAGEDIFKIPATVRTAEQRVREVLKSFLDAALHERVADAMKWTSPDAKATDRELLQFQVKALPTTLQSPVEIDTCYLSEDHCEALAISNTVTVKSPEPDSKGVTVTTGENSIPDLRRLVFRLRKANDGWPIVSLYLVEEQRARNLIGDFKQEYPDAAAPSGVPLIDIGASDFARNPRTVIEAYLAAVMTLDDAGAKELVVGESLSHKSVLAEWRTMLDGDTRKIPVAIAVLQVSETAGRALGISETLNVTKGPLKPASRVMTFKLAKVQGKWRIDKVDFIEAGNRDLFVGVFVKEFPDAAAPAQGLDFLSAYAALRDLSLEMTHSEFLALAEKRNLNPVKSTASPSQVAYTIDTGDGLAVIVMFRKETGQCTGIQRVRSNSAASAPGKVDPQNPQSVLDAYVAALLEGRLADAFALAVPHSEAAKVSQFEGFARLIANKSIHFPYFHTDEATGCAFAISGGVKLTDPSPDGTTAGVLTFLLERQRGKWLVMDVNFGSDETAREQLAAWLEPHWQATAPPQTFEAIGRATPSLAGLSPQMTEGDFVAFMAKSRWAWQKSSVPDGRTFYATSVDTNNADQIVMAFRDGRFDGLLFMPGYAPLPAYLKFDSAKTEDGVAKSTLDAPPVRPREGYRDRTGRSGQQPTQDALAARPSEQAVRAVVERLIAAVYADDAKAAGELATPPMRFGERLGHFRELFDGQPVKVDFVHANGEDAIAHTQKLRGTIVGSERLELMLKKEQDRWLIMGWGVKDDRRMIVDIYQFTATHPGAGAPKFSDPRLVVEAFLGCALGGQPGKAAAMADVAAKPALEKQVAEFPQTYQVMQIGIAEVKEAGRGAIVTSRRTFLTEGRRRRAGVLTFDLENKDGAWRITQIDFGSEEDAQRKLSGLAKKSPEADKADLPAIPNPAASNTTPYPDTPRSVVDAFVVAALAGKRGEAGAFTVPEIPGRAGMFDGVRTAEGIQSLKLPTAIIAEEGKSLVFSERVMLRQPNPFERISGVLVFHLSAYQGQFRITFVGCIDEDAIEKEVANFHQQFPKAVQSIVPSARSQFPLPLADPASPAPHEAAKANSQLSPHKLEPAKADPPAAVSAVRSVCEEFLAAVIRLDTDSEQARKHVVPDSPLLQHLPELHEMLALKPQPIHSVAVSEQGGHAIAVSAVVQIANAVTGGTDPRVATIRLVKGPGGKWLIDQLEFDTEAKGEKKLTAFAQQFPDAAPVPQAAGEQPLPPADRPAGETTSRKLPTEPFGGGQGERASRLAAALDDVTSLGLAIIEARGELIMAEQEVQRVSVANELGIAIPGGDINAARAKFHTAEEKVKFLTGRAQAAYDAAHRELETERANTARMKQLIDKMVITQEEMDKANAALKTAEAKVEALRAVPGVESGDKAKEQPPQAEAAPPKPAGPPDMPLARDVIEGYVTALLAGKPDEARQFFVEPDGEGMKGFVAQMGQALAGKTVNIPVIKYSVTRGSAIGVSTTIDFVVPLQATSDSGILVFQLGVQNGRWVLGDIDIVNDQRAANKLEKFTTQCSDAVDAAPLSLHGAAAVIGPPPDRK